MLKEMPEDEFGPGINIREYSLLDNPSMPKQVKEDHLQGISRSVSSSVNHCVLLCQVKESWLDVKLCQGGTKDCQVTNSTSSPGMIRLPKRSNEETVIR